MQGRNEISGQTDGIYGSSIGTEGLEAATVGWRSGKEKDPIVLSLDKLREMAKAWPMEDGCKNVEVASIRDGLKTVSRTA